MKISNKIKLKLTQTYTSSTSGIRQHFVSDIVKNNNLELGAEIGVRTGQTLFHVIDNNPQLIMHAVDIDTSQFIKNVAGYGDRIIVHERLSGITPEFIEDKSLDFFFIDASHTYKNVKKDLTAWLPKLKDNGWMIGHDIDYPSVEQAVLDVVGFYEVGPDNVWFAKYDKTYQGIKKI
jgi:hypothetical protein